MTAISREGSEIPLPNGVNVKRVSYDDQSSLVKAMEGQDVVIITMNARAPEEQHHKLVKAAAEAKVPWVFPNEYGVSSEKNPQLGKDVFIGARNAGNRKQIEDLGVSSWIGFSCGFWYEFSLAGGEIRYGFDFQKKSMVYIDDGNTLINTSTWDQCGRAMAKLLSLKVLPDDENDKSPCLDQFRNKFVFISSFLVNQKDMMESVLRVTGDKPEDWTVSYENHKERYEAGVKALQAGDPRGFGQLLYTRVFYPDDSGNFEKTYGLNNNILGLPKEDLDERTKIAIDMALNNKVPY